MNQLLSDYRASGANDTGFVCAGVSYNCEWQEKVNTVLNVHRNRRLIRDGGGVVEVEVW